MKGKIDIDGDLWIQRGGKMKPQYCPCAPNNKGIYSECGDNCLFFGEPDELKLRPHNIVYELKICQDRTLYFDEFEDERRSGKNEV